MQTETAPVHRPVRRGRPICFTLDYDAEALLRAMMPNSKSLGTFVGELIRREAEQRVRRPEWLHALQSEATMTEDSRVK
jgi:hypothetical protein